MDVHLQTGWGIFEVLAHVSRSPLEAFRQFVENAADAVEQRGLPNATINIRLHRDEAGALRELVVEDSGIGIDSLKMDQVLHSIGLSDKVDRALRGEKGIGILAFALLAEELHLNSCAGDNQPSACLVLRRSDLREAIGHVLAPCPHHERRVQGTTAHLMGVLPEVVSSLSYERLREYLSREIASDLRRHLYTVQVEDGGRLAHVEPQRYRGLRIVSQSISLGSAGHAWVELHALPAEAPDATVSLLGEGGVRICSLSTLEAFQHTPWQDRRLEGYVRCDRLKRTADKTAVVQDRVYRELVAALNATEPQLLKEMQVLAKQHMEKRVGRVLRRVDHLVERFLRYIETGEPLRLPRPSTNSRNRKVEATVSRTLPSAKAPGTNGHNGHNGHNGARHQFQPLHFHIAAPADSYSERRSWRSAEAVVQVNQSHADFLEAEQDEARCARYMFALWAKEHLLMEYGSDAERMAEELVGWLLKVDPLLVRAPSR